jgi:rRNA biogenesis protein RRP5
LVLGQISQINAQDLAIALPNNLTGYVSLTRISSSLTKTIKALVEDADQEDDDIDVPSLAELFIIGQWLRTVVVENTAVTGSSDKSQKKHIELSVEPELVNASSVADDILPQTLLQVSVSSIEDHGIIVSLGLPNLSGFIKNSSLGAYSVDNIKEGQVFLACVEQKPKNKVVQLTLNLKKSQKPIADVADIGSLLPGETVKCLVSEVRAAGAGGKILGMLDATIDQLHIGQAPVSDNQNVKSLGNCNADLDHCSHYGCFPFCGSSSSDIVSFTSYHQSGRRKNSVRTITIRSPARRLYH